MREFWRFLMENKAWWITPIVVILGGLLVIILCTEGSGISPFIYNLF